MTNPLIVNTFKNIKLNLEEELAKRVDRLKIAEAEYEVARYKVKETETILMYLEMNVINKFDSVVTNENT